MLRSIATIATGLLAVAFGAPAEQWPRDPDALKRLFGPARDVRVDSSTASAMPRAAFESGEEVWIDLQGYTAGEGRRLYGLIVDAHGELVAASAPDAPVETTSGGVRLRLIDDSLWEAGLPVGIANVLLVGLGSSDPRVALLDSLYDEGLGIVPRDQAQRTLASLREPSVGGDPTAVVGALQIPLVVPTPAPRSRGLGRVKVDAGPPIVSAEQIIQYFAPRGRGVRRRKVDLRIGFAFDSAEIDRHGRRQLAELATALADATLSRHRFAIAGHTDRQGSADYNMALSKRRARAVREHLIDALHLEPDRFDARGYGFAHAVDPRDTDRAHAANRRVEFELLR